MRFPSAVLRRRIPVAVAMLVARIIGILAAQELAPPPAFEVASVRPAPGGPIVVKSDPGRLTMRNESVDVMIELAYGLREYQYEGPGWLHTARYDVLAA